MRASTLEILLGEESTISDGIKLTLSESNKIIQKHADPLTSPGAEGEFIVTIKQNVRIVYNLISTLSEDI